MSARHQGRWVILIAALAFAGAPRTSEAHGAALTTITTTFHIDGTYRVVIRDDVSARLAGSAPGTLTEADLQRVQSFSAQERREAEERLFKFVRRSIKPQFDGSTAAYQIELLGLSASTTAASAGAPRPREFICLTGAVPAGAKSFRLFCSKVLGDVVLTLQHEGGAPTIQRLTSGGYSDPYPIVMTPDYQAALAVTWTFLVLGFKHILPLGWDHIAFVVCLFLLSSRLKPLLWQVTAFTVAHSITLSLAVLGVVSLSQDAIGRIVEPLIAASIAFVAIENLFTDKLKPWRPIVVFAFGLLHGLGFASVLLELGVPKDRYINALASFNGGVELGQISIIGLALLVAGRFRKRTWYRHRIVVPASAAIAVLGVFVAIERFVS